MIVTSIGRGRTNSFCLYASLLILPCRAASRISSSRIVTSKRSQVLRFASSYRWSHSGNTMVCLRLRSDWIWLIYQYRPIIKLNRLSKYRAAMFNFRTKRTLNYDDYWTRFVFEFAFRCLNNNVDLQWCSSVSTRRNVQVRGRHIRKERVRFYGQRE